MSFLISFKHFGHHSKDRPFPFPFFVLFNSAKFRNLIKIYLEDDTAYGRKCQNSNFTNTKNSASPKLPIFIHKWLRSFFIFEFKKKQESTFELLLNSIESWKERLETSNFFSPLCPMIFSLTHLKIKLDQNLLQGQELDQNKYFKPIKWFLERHLRPYAVSPFIYWQHKTEKYS